MKLRRNEIKTIVGGYLAGQCNTYWVLDERGQRYKWSYPKIMDKRKEVREKIENEYESYFCFYNAFGHKAGYDWVNGNHKLKELLNLN